MNYCYTEIREKREKTDLLYSKKYEIVNFFELSLFLYTILYGEQKIKLQFKNLRYKIE